MTKNPNEEQLDAVETSLYNRMAKNAFFGFLKSAAIGAVVGLALGGLAAAAVGAGLLPSIGFLSGDIVAGALHAAAWFGGLAGSFGAVAGIQSTRDTRRFFLMHENPEFQSPEDTRVPALVMQPGAPEKSCGCHFQQKLDQSRQIPTESPRL